jgi:putative FmdB family regulatory protein
MPTYEYACDGCGHEFEKFQSITASTLRKCPECGKLKLRRLIGTGAGVIFKGSGFYQTDYRSDSYGKAAQADKPAEKSADSGAGKSDSAGGKGKAKDKAAG